MKNQPENPYIVLGGGCFWCTEALYQRLEGVLSVEPGYTGGDVERPTYEQICTGTTGHAEVVKITFDPARITLRELLDFFWEAHDPTTLNRQGADVGTQYRSAIFYRDAEEKAEAEASREAFSTRFAEPIVTEITPLKTFYPAEAYHHDYYANNASAPYCRYVIAPKLDELEKRN